MDNESRNSSLINLLIITIAMMPLCYVLSIGPVIAVVEKTGIPNKPFKIFYAPVIWLSKNTPLSTPLKKYAKFWGWH